MKKQMRSKFPARVGMKVNVQNPKPNRKETIEMYLSFVALLVIFGLLAIVA